MSTSRNHYTPAQQELRAIAFSVSSENVPGARYVDGWHQHDPRPTGFPQTNDGYLPLDVIADLDSAAEKKRNPDGCWKSVPSPRIVKRRERHAAHRKERDATFSWLGRTEEPGVSLAETYSRRSDWVLRKDGSHELLTR